MNPVSLFILFCFPAIMVIGQDIQDTVRLEEVSIKAFLDPAKSGFKKTRIDSITLLENINCNLSDLLKQHSPVFVKSYGQGSLATPSFRGTGASHTQILWNEINLNSPMLGQTDLSTIPVFLTDQVTLYYGASSLTESTGGFGGSILISNQPDWNNKLSVQLIQSAGSFSTYNSFAGFAIGNRKIQSRTRFIYASSKNDFSFKNIDKPGDPIEKRENADYRTTGLQQELYARISKHHVISTRIWAQWNNRNIPSSTVVSTSEGKEYQDDQFLRGLIEWKWFQQKGIFKLKTGYFYEHMHYINETSFIDSRNTINTLFGKLNYEYNLTNFLSVNGGIEHYFYYVNTNNFDDDKERNQTSLFGIIKFNHNERLFADLVLREELIDNNLLPFMPAFGISYKLLKAKQIYLKANISRNYHAPTLNDLYWGYDGFAGGNPDLQPEKGFSGDIGVSYQGGIRKKVDIGLELTGYFITINDMIFWYPVSGPTVFWTPQNLKKVNSRGIEASFEIRVPVYKFEFSLLSGYTFTRSVNEEVPDELDGSKGKQLIYVPEHAFNASFRISRNNFMLTWNTNYVGKRYTTVDNTRYLPAYTLNDIIIEKKFELKKLLFALQININNIWDIDYRAIVRQPMPGRNFLISLIIKIVN